MISSTTAANTRLGSNAVVVPGDNFFEPCTNTPMNSVLTLGGARSLITESKSLYKLYLLLANTYPE